MKNMMLAMVYKLRSVDPVAVPKIQFNDAVTLSCMASGSDVSYQWFNGSSEVLDTERILLSVDRKTLMISRVVRSDDGPFYCYVYNNVSNSTSKPFNLGSLPRTDYSLTTVQLASVIIGSFLAGIFLSVITVLFVKFIRRSAICGKFPESKPDKNENTSVNYENVHNTKKLDKDISVTSPNTDHLYM
ncbi:carcinoembryonic antigen-related cell adhesion molecule 20-like, partial [Polypterus senegalus]|uniref:carcinoembryonic antigen-related cell adhesion molecule 20-like n=1 Tax=Polypterus senegalus TaxID=55291 RepID=UPI001963DEF0